MRINLRRSLVVGAAVLTLGAGATPANAALSLCGDPVANSLVRIDACYDYESGVYRAAGTFMPQQNFSLTDWSYCRFVVAYFEGGVKKRHYEIDCRTAASSGAGVRYQLTGILPVDPPSGMCSYVKSMWEGTFRGNAVGSAGNAVSRGVCPLPD